MTKVIILDRDGVINHDSLHYIKTPDEWLAIESSLQAIATLTRAGFTLAVATNQSGIARGLYDEATLGAIHDKMQKQVKQAGGKIDKIWHCPHMPDSGCSWRKPAPGMLLAIAEHYQIAIEQTYFVGDRVTDIEAALAVNAKPVLVESPMTDFEDLNRVSGYQRFSSLADFVEQLIS